MDGGYNYGYDEGWDAAAAAAAAVPARLPGAGGVAALPSSCDDSANYVRVLAPGFHAAMESLEDRSYRYPIRELVVDMLEDDDEFRGPFDDDDDDDEDYGWEYDQRDDGPYFRQFVDRLGDMRHGGKKIVKNITLQERWVGLPKNYMTRLFQHVLPNHPTLEGIHVDICDLDIRYVRMLTENVRSLSNELRIGHSGNIDPDTQEQVVQAIVSMLRRRNVAITSLQLHLFLEEHQCQRICQALRGNDGARLKALIVEVKDVRAGTLDGAAASSSLKGLHVTGHYADDAVASLTAQLRSNVTLEYLQIMDCGPHREISEREALAFVKTYNYTLRAAYVLRPARRGALGTTPKQKAKLLDVYRTIGDQYLPPVEDQLPIYMSRNEQIRMGLEKLKQEQVRSGGRASSSSSLSHTTSDRPRLIPKRLLPQLVGLVTDLPTVLYRVLRMGYGVDVSDCVMDARGRRRRRPGD